MNGIPESDRQLFARLPFAAHGGVALPDVFIDSYSVIFREKGHFVGDKVTKSAFIERLDALRKKAARHGEDPFGDVDSAEISKRDFARILSKGDPAAATIVDEAFDAFAADLFAVIERFRAHEEWRRVKRIAVGGGFSDGRIGRLAVARAQTLLHDASIDCEIVPIMHDPDEAGLIGAAYLAPPWVFAGFDAVIGVDIGGTNMRCGAVGLKLSKAKTISKARVLFSDRWKHAEDEPNRSEATTELIDMIAGLVRKCARKKVRLAPFIGIGCPGRIRPDGTIDRGAQNLPGKWEGEKFNLPALLRDGVTILKSHETVVTLHNDAVVQGLSQIPAMREVKHWGILTIGTGLGNATFTNRGG